MNFGVLVFPGAEELDFAGPWEMVRVWSKVAGGPENCLKVAEQKDPVPCAKGMLVVPHDRAGLLSGRKATTHWASLERLRSLGDVTVVEERFVQDGFVWTAAGVSAGIDMTLAFIAHVAGAEAAGKVKLTAEYYPSRERYGGAGVHAQAPQYARGV